MSLSVNLNVSRCLRHSSSPQKIVYCPFLNGFLRKNNSKTAKSLCFRVFQCAYVIVTWYVSVNNAFTKTWFDGRSSVGLVGDGDCAGEGDADRDMVSFSWVTVGGLGVI